VNVKDVLQLPRRMAWRIRKTVVPKAKRVAATQTRELAKQSPVASGDGNRLRQFSEDEMTSVMASPEILAEWASIEARVTATGNVPGLRSNSKRSTQYGLYFLVRALEAGSVLEIGTHLGCSAGFISLAMARNRELGKVEAQRLVTIDAVDVNHPDPNISFWRKTGTPLSPTEFIKEIGCGDMVEFVTSDSVEFLKSCEETFDFIFVDGSHDARDVYQELSEVFRLVKPGGIIALHDYNPLYGAWEPLDRTIPGPFLAVQRFVKEGTKFHIVPVVVPWWPSEAAPRQLNLVLLARE
jgi:predicted O-methyltransferase YrrM